MYRRRATGELTLLLVAMTAMSVYTLTFATSFIVEFFSVCSLSLIQFRYLHDASLPAPALPHPAPAAKLVDSYHVREGSRPCSHCTHIQIHTSRIDIRDAQGRIAVARCGTDEGGAAGHVPRDVDYPSNGDSRRSVVQAKDDSWLLPLGHWTGGSLLFLRTGSVPGRLPVDCNRRSTVFIQVDSN